MTKQAISDNVRLKRQQLAAAEKYVLEGWGPSRIARQLDIPVPRAVSLIKAVQRRWIKESPEELETKRAAAIRRLQHVANAAMEAFTKSTEDREEVTVQSKPELCKPCGGTGADGACPVCDGEGVIVQETITRTSRGQSGDSSMLQVARQCWEGVAKLQGLNPKATAPTQLGVLVMDPQTLERFRQLPTETLLELRKRNQQALRKSAPPKEPPLEGKVVRSSPPAPQAGATPED